MIELSALIGAVIAFYMACCVWLLMREQRHKRRVKGGGVQHTSG